MRFGLEDLVFYFRKLFWVEGIDSLVYEFYVDMRCLGSFGFRGFNECLSGEM